MGEASLGLFTSVHNLHETKTEFLLAKMASFPSGGDASRRFQRFSTVVSEDNIAFLKTWRCFFRVEQETPG